MDDLKDVRGVGGTRGSKEKMTSVLNNSVLFSSLISVADPVPISVRTPTSLN